LADIPYSDYLRAAQTRLGDYLTPSVRLGVTGLSRAGKTVFITALVRNLIDGGRLPFFSPESDGRIVRAYLQPQPDDNVPRFDYEKNLGVLFADPPEWPEGTKRISELRLTVEYRPDKAMKRAVGLSKLHIDIVDYPGEWLVDLGLIEQDYAAFSRNALTLARDSERSSLSKPFLDFLGSLDERSLADEQTAMTGAKLFTDYLRAARATGAQATLAPGRFLLPGDLEGSPLLTFFPTDSADGDDYPKNSFAQMMARRYDSYKRDVVEPFFRQHFARLDRQIVLVDVLGAIDRGGASTRELERAMTNVLSVFRPQPRSWLSFIRPRAIDRVLFAATKADHVPATSHDRLSAILDAIISKTRHRVDDAGADVRALAIAAVRSTRETTAKHQGETLHCLTGTPMPGTHIAGNVFDGKTEAAVFPGDLPVNAEAALDKARFAEPGMLSLTSFRPPKLPKANAGAQNASLPHIRLDRALEFLLADYLS
jgi:uncharacterized protein